MTCLSLLLFLPDADPLQPSGRKNANAKTLGKVTGKARLVVRVFMQRKRLECLDMFSVTSVPSSIPMIANMALQKDWTLNLWDIEQAFSQSRIDRKILVGLPRDCRDVSGRVACLNKTFYVLRQ